MHTRAEELKAIVNDAWVATEALADEDSVIRHTAFERLLDHLLVDNHSFPTNEESQNGERESHTSSSLATNNALDTSYATGAQRAEAVGRYFDITADAAADLFELSNEVPELQIANRSLPESKAEAVRVIALLVCGVRTALGLETGSTDIRQIAEKYKKTDSNFARYLSDMPEIALRGKPGSQNRAVRMRVLGAEAARNIVADLVNE